MTEPAPAPADTAAPPSAPPSANPPAPPADTGPKAFTIPDAYKDKPWASKIKSEEDVYKQLDGAQELIGKKKIVPKLGDPSTDPKEVEEFYAALRPADKKAYEFGEGADPEFSGTVGDIFMKNGISAHQGNAIIKEYQAFEAKQMEAARSADGFKAEMTKSFGEKFDAHVSAVVKEHKQHLSAEDQALMDQMPNQYLGAVYRLTEAMRKAYGASETGAPAAPGASVPGQNLETRRKELRTKIREMDSRPHTAEEKQKLVDELANTYKG